METDCLAVKECGDEGIGAGRGPGQLGWYRFALRHVEHKSVLDVGCGLGHGLAILQSRASLARGQDVDPRLACDDVSILDLREIEGGSYDVVTSIDVIEHVPDPDAFVEHLTRIARELVFVTTPNWAAGRCLWPYHLREFLPWELERLLARHGEVIMFKGTPSGSAVYPVRHGLTYHTFNRLRNWPPTGFATRCTNRLLPERLRIQSHIGALLRVG